MKRRLYFLLDQLKITPAERKTVTGLFTLLLMLVTLNIVVAPSAPFGEEDYAELDAQFRQRSAELKARHAQIMQRYEPAKEKVTFVAADTVSPDSSQDNREEQPQPSKAELQPGTLRVNINTAGKEALETLPGIGPVYARRILEYRRDRGSFTHLEELKNIQGIGEKRLEKLKPFIKLTDSD